MRSVVDRNFVMRRMTVFYKHLSLLNSGHDVVITTHWYKYWPPVRFPPTDEKSDAF